MSTFEFYPGNHIVSASQATVAEVAALADNVPVTASAVTSTQHPVGPQGRNFITLPGTVIIV